VHPGGVATEIANSARSAAGIAADELARGRVQMNKMLKLPPAAAGEIIVKAIEAERRRVIVGNDAKVMAVIERLMPVSYFRVFERMARP
jgi:Flp pilus assembly CpaF family ATPase